MGAEPVQDWRQAAASALEWWCDAGIDTLIDDDPRDWLARPAAAASAGEGGKVAVEAPPEILPTTLEDFIAWRLGPAAPEAQWVSHIIAPAGPADARTVVMLDMPEPEDRESLLGGDAGQLFDRMLAAIGLSRETIYLCSFAVARPVTSMVPPDQEARLAQLARHHLSLLRPERVLLLGKAAASLTAGSESTDGLEGVNLFGGTMRVVASHAPRFLLTHPAAKGETWRHLLQLSRGGQ